MDIAGVGCVAVIGLLIGMVAGAAVLRAAVALANRMIGPVRTAHVLVDDWDWDAEPEEERPRRTRDARAIPEPSVGKGMAIASAANVLTAFVAFVLGTVAEETGVLDEEAGGAIVVGLIALLCGSAGFTVLLVPMLPTTFTRAALVAFLYYLFGLLILLVVGGAVFAAWHLAGG